MKQISRKRKRKITRMALRRRGVVRVICCRVSLDTSEFIAGLTREMGKTMGLPSKFFSHHELANRY